MADSQNTYQNDVKIKETNNFLKILIGVVVSVAVIIGGYSFYNSEKSNAYDNGFDEGYSKAKYEGKDKYEKGYEAGYDKGYEDGKNTDSTAQYTKGYNEGYNQGKKDAKSSSNNSSKSSGTVEYYIPGGSSNTNNYSTNNEKEYSYVLFKNTKKFHYSNCRSVKQMADKNKKFHTGTRSEVIEMGYSPCGNCHP